MRLIDADTLVKDLSYLYTKNHIPVDMRTKEILTTIMEQPTAYDIEKVVEELEIERKTANNTYNSFNMDVDLGRVFGLEKAIEIVKQGCVSDDLCEWEDKGLYGYYTSCTEFRSRIACKDTYWKYCPYCGKKIKVVCD